MPANNANRTDRSNWRVPRGSGALVALIIMSLMIASAMASPEVEVQAAFDRFVTAQNNHDIKAVESQLLDSADFLWVTRGTAVWGHDAAIKRFAGLYEGTWRLEPDTSKLKIVLLGSGVAQIHVPIMFTIGAIGESPKQTRFLMNQFMVNTPNGWKVSSILPIPAPAQ